MKQKLILFSLILGLIISGSKFYAYYVSNSITILTDALESLINVVASAFALYSVYLSAQPKDFNHPYGHGKIEFFSSGLEGVLIILAGFFLIGHAAVHLVNPVEIGNINIGIYVAIISGVLNALLGYLLVYEGNKTNSPALNAEGQHLKLDALNGLFILISLGFTYFFKFSWIDPVASIILSILMLFQGFKLIKSSSGALMDERDEETYEKLIDYITNNQKNTWIDLHNLRIQQYGGDFHIDCHLTLPRYWNLNQVHEEIHEFEEIINSLYDSEIEIFIHADPCLDDCCSHCNIQDCPIRKAPFTKKIEWNKVNLGLNQKHFLEEI
jgi:cation diffusion facilitator family transporter